GPSMIPFGPADRVGKSNSVISPSTVIRPTLWPAYSVNQRWPSCPVIMPTGWQSRRGNGNARNIPVETSMRQIWPAPLSQNQSPPSGPKVRIYGWLSGCGIRCSMISGMPALPGAQGGYQDVPLGQPITLQNRMLRALTPARNACGEKQCPCSSDTLHSEAGDPGKTRTCDLRFRKP